MRPLHVQLGVLLHAGLTFASAVVCWLPLAMIDVDGSVSLSALLSDYRVCDRSRSFPFDLYRCGRVSPCWRPRAAQIFVGAGSTEYGADGRCRSSRYGVRRTFGSRTWKACTSITFCQRFWVLPERQLLAGPRIPLAARLCAKLSLRDLTLGDS